MVMGKTTMGESASKKPRPTKRDALGKLLDGLPASTVGFVEPMKCRLLEKLPQGEGWLYEIKFDGFRGLAMKNGAEAQLLSRNNRDLGGKFPGVVRALRKLPCEQLILDGEVVALDAQGRSSFQMLQRAGDPGHQNSGLVFYAFDVLHVNGKDTTSLPLTKRKALLKTLVGGKSECILVSDALRGDVDELTSAMRQLGLEGIIAKKRDSPYEIGQRSGAWVKFKWGFEQEFVIGGYTDPEGSRPYFGSVLVGYYDGERLIFAAKVGTGFNTRLLKSLYDQFQKIRIERTPFANLPERGGHLTAAQMRFCKWIAPKLVCQVRFTEWTQDGHLRQPVFLGLRDDKNPREVIKETAGTSE
jgi:bifunctional non-homologous end joining protein LigD